MAANLTHYDYTNPFSVCFTTMKIRYNDYDKSIDSMNFVQPTDKVNVFINFESVLNNLSMVRDVESKLLLERNFPLILESEAINLCAHYKRFFRGNGLDTRVFLYYTDLTSKEYPQFKYNDEYRIYYGNKYLTNPKFQLLGNKLVKRIVPRIQKIMEFIPGVYFISAKGIEGSLIPYIIAEAEPEYKNFIITTDRYDTQYLLKKDKFCTHYIRKSPLGTAIFNQFDRYLCDLFKETYNSKGEPSIFNNSSFYTILLSALGDKIRSIDPLKGLGCKTVQKYLLTAMTSGLFTKETSSFDLISTALPEDLVDPAFKSFKTINLTSQYNDISQDAVFNITSQIVDRFDHNSLLELNAKDYKEYPLMLPELTC